MQHDAAKLLHVGVYIETKLLLLVLCGTRDSVGNMALSETAAFVIPKSLETDSARCTMLQDFQLSIQQLFKTA